MHKDGDLRACCAAGTERSTDGTERNIRDIGAKKKKKNQKKNPKEQMRLKERRSCLLFAPARLRQGKSSLGLAGKQLLSL